MINMTSEIVVDGEVIDLSFDLLKNPSLLQNILTLTTWENELSSKQQNDLLKTLPQSLTEEENMETVRMLFSGEDLTAFSEICAESQTGNPISEMAIKLSKGHFTADAYRLRRSYSKTARAKQKLLRHEYYHHLLKEILISRQCHLHVAANPEKLRLSRPKAAIEMNDCRLDAKVELSAKRMYRKILSEVDIEARSSVELQNETFPSSDSESDEQIPSGKPPGSLLVAPNRIKELLLQHKRRREARVNTPDLNVNGIKLPDVMSRTYAGGRKVQGVMTKKRKREENLKLAKKRVKGNASGAKSKSSHHSRRASKSKLPHSKSKFATTPGCFFELLKDVMLLSQDKTTLSITQLTSDWLSSAEASLYLWTTKRHDWKDVLPNALEFMSTKREVGSQEKLITEEEGRWVWHGFREKGDESKLLKNMCDDWLELVSKLFGVDVITPVEDATQAFQVQEQRRFLYPHQAFVYTINGKRYAVPPVKGSTGPSKEGRVAREHCLLRSERPPQVTLLALTRDAVARLPGGTGTRNDVCSLIRESQYLASIVTEAQISSAVSGALDRLHYENDPCVKFDAVRRLWVYLHADRSIEDLERLHAEQLGAPKKKRTKEKSKKKEKPPEEETATPKSTSAKSTSTPDSKLIDRQAPDVSANPIVQTPASHTNGPNSADHKQVCSPLPSGKKSDVRNAQSSSERLVGVKKKTKKSKASVASTAGVSLGTSHSGVTTIQLTQKQLLEMTRKLSNSAATSRTPREVLITHRDSSVVKKWPNSGQVTASLAPSHVKGKLVPQQNGQPSLKLILKPAADDKQKPTAELVRVVPPGSVARNAPSNKHHVLTTDALRRLSEQLSAASNRPVKIVQQSLATDGKSAAGAEQRVINISTSSESSLTAKHPRIAVSSESAGMPALHVPAMTGVRNSGNFSAPSTAAEKPPRRIVITSKSDAATPAVHPVSVAQNAPTPQIVHVVPRSSSLTAPTYTTNKTSSVPMQVVKTSRTFPANLQVVQNPPHAVQIVSGGKIQTVQVLGGAKSPILSAQGRSPARNIVISHAQQSLPGTASPKPNNVVTRPVSTHENT